MSTVFKRKKKKAMKDVNSHDVLLEPIKTSRHETAGECNPYGGGGEAGNVSTKTDQKRPKRQN